MNPFEAVMLGLTQGVTEFIPVSSSGHLSIVEQMMGGGNESFHLFLEFVNVGTLLALVIFFRKRIWKILQDVFVRKNYRLAVNLLVTSIPAGVIGVLIAPFIGDIWFFNHIFVIGVAMGAVGVLMIMIEKLPHLRKLKDEKELGWGRALVIGLAQVFALVPGVSRSGATIVTGRLMGLNSEAAAEYSFLASIPLMCGVVLRTFISGDALAYLGSNVVGVVLSNLVAFGAGMVALRFLFKYLKRRNSLRAFGWYRVILAGFVLIIALIV